MAKTRESIMSEQPSQDYDALLTKGQDASGNSIEKLNGDGSNGYGGQNMQILQGFEAVRLRSGMYIGSTDQRGLHHLIYEVVDNSVDEVWQGMPILSM